MSFPTVTGDNLLGERYTLPQDFEAPLNIALIAYEQYHQRDVDTWLPTVGELVAEFDNLADYELPVVGEMPVWGRMMLDFWMRNGIPDPATRRKTITLYTDRAAFNAPLNLPDANRIYVLLVTQAGDVLWQTSGAHSKEKASGLREAILTAQTNSPAMPQQN